MEPFSMVSMGMGILGGVMDFVGGFTQAGKQRQLTDRYVEQLRLANKQKLGDATSLGASSGVEFESSSLQKYLSEMAAQFRAQEDWARSVGYDTASSLASTGVFKGLTDIGGSMFQFAKDNNFWRQPK